MTVQLRAGDVRVDLFPDDGGRVGQIDVGGRQLLRGREHAALGWGWWGSYPLVPWSNRIPGGVVRFEGREFRVPVNWEDGSALHGLTAWVPWTVTDTDGDRAAAMEIELTEGGYEVIGRQRFEVTPAHLDQTLEVENRGQDRVPVGLGIHPWFRAGPIRIPADAIWPGAGPMPDGPPVAVSGDFNLRQPRVPVPMDRCFAALTDTHADVPGVRLHWDGPVTQIVVYSGTAGWVCVEPVTMANNGFALMEEGQPGTGVIALDPGASTSVRYRFEFLAG